MPQKPATKAELANALKMLVSWLAPKLAPYIDAKTGEVKAVFVRWSLKENLELYKLVESAKRRLLQ